VGYQAEMNAQFNELINAAQLLSQKRNVIEREDNGLYYIQATGQLEECIDALEVMKQKLMKIKEQKV